MKRLVVVVRGRVQGVGFRFSTATRARSLGLAGWVRNRPDGTVEAAFEGERDRVDSMVEWCRCGPRGALVTDVETHQEAVTGEQGFVLR